MPWSALVWAVSRPQPARVSVASVRPFGRGLGDAVHAAQEQRVVGEQQVGVPVGGFLSHRQHRVDGQQDPAYVGLGIARRQPDGVPVVGGLGRVPAVDQIHDLSQCRSQRRHAPTLARARTVPASRSGDGNDRSERRPLAARRQPLSGTRARAEHRARRSSPRTPSAAVRAGAGAPTPAHAERPQACRIRQTPRTSSP